MATLDDAGVVSVRIYKRKASNPSIVWANTYEVYKPAGPVANVLMTDVNNMVGAEANIHLESTQFVRALISTWVPDGEPYNPLSFVSVPLTQIGSRSEAGSAAEPLQMCYRIAFKTMYGRQGFRLYRNCLLESDVAAPSGVPILDYSGTQSGFAAFQTAMSAYFDDTEPPYLVLASAGNIRTVTGVSEAGVTVKKFNNRFYDRVA